MLFHTAPQGSEEWLDARRGVITGSKFKDCRDFKQPNKEQKAAGKTRGDPSAKMTLYAMNVARERCGGRTLDVYQNGAMRFGTEQEPLARIAYESRTGHLVEEAGFITTDDRLFGVSVDGLVGPKGLIEIKTMVSSENLFDAVTDGDNSEFIDQINGEMWLLGRDWCDLILWAPDLHDLGLSLTVRRIKRDDEVIQELQEDLMAFAALVRTYENKLRRAAAANLDLLKMAA